METTFLKIFYDSICDRLLQMENFWASVVSIEEIWKVYSNIDWTYRYVYRIKYGIKMWYELEDVKKSIRELVNKCDF